MNMLDINGLKYGATVIWSVLYFSVFLWLKYSATVIWSVLYFSIFLRLKYSATVIWSVLYFSVFTVGPYHYIQRYKVSI